MSKKRYERVEMTLLEGQNAIEKKVSIPRGDRVYVQAVAKPTYGKLLKIGLFENGAEIHTPMDESHYNGKNGSFEMRGLELAYQGGSELTVKVSTNDVLPAGTNIEVGVVFLIHTQESC